VAADLGLPVTSADPAVFPRTPCATLGHGPVRAVAYSADGARIAVASDGPPTVTILRASDGVELESISLEAATGTLERAAFSADGAVVLSRPGVANVAPATLAVAASRLAFSPDGGYLATAAGGQVNLWCRE
jgi:hypothetical protein